MGRLGKRERKIVEDCLKGDLIPVGSGWAISLIVGKVVHTHDLKFMDLIERVIAHNPHHRPRNPWWYKLFRTPKGHTYLEPFYSLAEVAKIYFEHGPDHLRTLFQDPDRRRETLRRAQMLYCISCARDVRFKEFFKEVASQREDPDIVNNALYGLGYLGVEDEYDFIFDFLEYDRAFCYAAAHIVTLWTHTPDQLVKVKRKLDELCVKYPKESRELWMGMTTNPRGYVLKEALRDVLKAHGLMAGEIIGPLPDYMFPGLADPGVNECLRA